MNPYDHGTTPATPSPTPAPGTPARVVLPFEFRGSGGEYFRIWIVNLLLTIVTLGIYSAWAKVRRLRYFYGNTILDGHSFEYHGQPLQILKGRLIVVAAYVVVWIMVQIQIKLAFILIPAVFLLTPWIIMRARRFQMRMTSYRNLRFGFHGTYGGAMAAFIGWYFLVVITLSILYPVWVRKRVQYTLDNISYGRQQFQFVSDTASFYKVCLITFVLAMCAYFGFIFTIFNLGSVAELLRSNPTPTQLELAMALGVAGWVLLLLGGVVGMTIAAYYNASIANISFGGIKCGAQWVRSNLRVTPLIGIYVTNLLGIVFTLGLFYPWAKVRLAKYHLENTAIDSDGRLGEITAGAGSDANVIAEEASDLLDVDFGI